MSVITQGPAWFGKIVPTDEIEQDASSACKQK